MAAAANGGGAEGADTMSATIALRLPVGTVNSCNFLLQLLAEFACKLESSNHLRATSLSHHYVKHQGSSLELLFFGAVGNNKGLCLPRRPRVFLNHIFLRIPWFQVLPFHTSILPVLFSLFCRQVVYYPS